jgi:hypothetical protein
MVQGQLRQKASKTPISTKQAGHSGICYAGGHRKKIITKTQKPQAKTRDPTQKNSKAKRAEGVWLKW